MNPPDSEAGRTCRKPTGCGAWKPWAELVPKAGCKYGVRPLCRTCGNKAHAVTTAAWEGRNPNRRWEYRGTVGGRAGSLVGNARNRAKKKNLAFGISTEWVVERFATQGGRCAITGIPFTMLTPRQKLGEAAPYPLSPSLDQIVAGRGYTEDNTRLVCDGVNKLWGCGGDGPAHRIAVEVATRHAPEETAAALRALGYIVVPPGVGVAA